MKLWRRQPFARASNFFYFLFLAFSYSSSRNRFRCHPAPEAVGTRGITVPDWDFHLVAHCADTAGRTMSPYRRVLVYLTSYHIILPASAFASSKYRYLPILHVSYSTTSSLVNICIDKGDSLSTSPAKNPIWITSTHNAVTATESSISRRKTMLLFFCIPL